MSVELDCKWHFPEMPDNTGDEGPNSAMSQTFSQFPCSALVRESIQNSLDAVLDTSEPVTVCFEHMTMSRTGYANFFKLADHIQGCKEYYNDNKTACAIYPAMLDCLNTQQIGFIKVSDYNTKGMDYQEGCTDKTFYAFVRAAGVSVKQAEGAGGSFGFGKGAFFVMSPLNTLIVSTHNKEGNTYFEGVARLCSHKLNGQMRSHIGFYDNNGGKPVSNPDLIPALFKREDSGTSIGIMGVEWEKWVEAKEELIKEVLSNFFVAILRKKLIVYINGNIKNSNNATIIIDDTTLPQLMRTHFVNTKDTRKQGNFNPRPYFEAMTGEDTHFFKETLPTLGEVELYLKEFDNNVTQIIFMRKLLMKVFREGYSLGNLNGVFICENALGNKILGDMEDPEHKNWACEQCKKTEIETDYEVAVKAKSEIEGFIRSCLEEILCINATESLQVSGLEKYLPSLESQKGKGDKGNPFYGQPTGKYTKDGSSLTTEGELKAPQPKVRGKKGAVIEIDLGKFRSDSDGDINGGTGGGNPGNGGDAPGPGDNFRKGIVEDGKGRFKRLIDVDWRPIQSLKTGHIDIIIYPPKTIKDAELVFQIGRESSSKREGKEDVYIASSSKGTAEGLTIKGVNLTKDEKNIIQISFSDKMSYTLMLGVYEIN